MPTKTAFVGLSGGVDSSVAALRLKNQGYQVVGVFIKVWHPDWLVCNWEQERLDAMRVAAKLDIPFLTCDAVDTYRDDVAEYFITEYKAGRTPNPDVMCNKYVKFGRFLDFAHEHGADLVATGHYAQRVDKEGVATLHRGIDANKDQTYFLWTLTQEQLTQTLFPVGDSPKASIRAEAEAAGLLTAEKKDSQGICFLGHIDITEFLSHYVELVPGDVLDENGEVIGTHHGALVYTLGQRHGFTITNTSAEQPALYVYDRNLEKNTLTVHPERPRTSNKDQITLREVSFTHDRAVEQLLDGFAIQTRYRQTPIGVNLIHIDSAEIVLKPVTPLETPAAGQSCVLYQGSECLGGGIIQ